MSDFADLPDYPDGFWVFGYGSLMWRPGFRHIARRCAVLSGHHRSFCLRSVTYRGTPESPGLVLGLDPAAGAQCRGVAFQVAPEDSAEALQYLRERELINRSYFERAEEIRFVECGSTAHALCYVIDRSHPQYSGALSLEEQAEIIARASGPMGPNADYLFNTAAHLNALGVTDDDLALLCELVRGKMT